MATVAIGIAVADADVVPGVPITATVLGTTSLALMASHALASNRQARALQSLGRVERLHPPDGLLPRPGSSPQ